MPAKTEILLTEKEAATRLALSKSTLARLRRRGAGPVVVKIGPLVRYEPAALELWVGEQVTKQGTGEQEVVQGDLR